MSENEKNTQNNGEDIEESNLAHRLRSLEGEESLQEESYEILCKPTTLKEKIENFWFHSKWKVIIITFLVVVAVVCVFQLVSHDNPDMYVIYAGPMALTPNEIYDIQDSFEDFGEDYNDDGKSIASLLDLVVMTDEQMQQIRADSVAASDPVTFNTNAIYNARQRFSSEMLAGDTVICLLDPNMYQSVYEAGGFMTLKEVFEDDIPEGITLNDECSVVLSSTDFGKKFAGVNQLPEDTLLCVRRVSTMGVFKGAEKVEKAHAYHVEVFKNILSYKSYS